MSTMLKKSDFGWAIGGPSGSFEELTKILEKKFGIYIYDDPCWEDNSDYAFIVSKRKLNKKGILEVSKLFNKKLYKEEEEDREIEKREEQKIAWDNSHTVYCLNCGTPINLLDNFRGRRPKCKKCGYQNLHK